MSSNSRLKLEILISKLGIELYDIGQRIFQYEENCERIKLTEYPHENTLVMESLFDIE